MPATDANEHEIPTPPWRKKRPTAPARQPLSQDLIVETAIRVLDAEGLDAVSMRRVAQELNTGPASLYAHVSNKEELLDLMLDQIVAEVELVEPDPERWQEQVKEVMRSAQRVYAAHRDIARASLGTVPTGPNALRIAENQLAIMRVGGVPKRVAALAVDTLGLYLEANSVEDSMYLSKLKDGESPHEYFEQYIGQIRKYFASLPVERFPNIVGMVDYLTDDGGDERFEFGLDIIVRGIASFAESAAGSDSAPGGGSSTGD
ncbi:TetR/AcrR family transcriptional regulator [Actinomadura barringtoniae]|uniref:TetR/AcrR family transcriptional regulator n=1 Tax=Actinomadura barringtoniae TaxID=1427535 RepID=A0A939TBY2_9ACTN|nr:TetR/AcrR family transcriptional regulator [Actinomadura barringtoniae]MBO2453997.1 TetR/AcrR family transcriptional regulator [Actinomadura barringtoniae]